MNEAPILAFPSQVDYYNIQHGMTLRDYFAAKAMQAMISSFAEIGRAHV